MLVSVHSIPSFLTFCFAFVTLSTTCHLGPLAFHRMWHLATLPFLKTTNNTLDILVEDNSRSLKSLPPSLSAVTMCHPCHAVRAFHLLTFQNSFVVFHSYCLSLFVHVNSCHCLSLFVHVNSFHCLSLFVHFPSLPSFLFNRSPSRLMLMLKFHELEHEHASIADEFSLSLHIPRLHRVLYSHYLANAISHWWMHVSFLIWNGSPAGSIVPFLGNNFTHSELVHITNLSNGPIFFWSRTTNTGMNRFYCRRIYPVRSVRYCKLSWAATQNLFSISILQLDDAGAMEQMVQVREAIWVNTVSDTAFHFWTIFWMFIHSPVGICTV